MTARSFPSKLRVREDLYLAEEICWLSAVELLARFRARTLSPVEVTEATLGRIERLQPLLNRGADMAIAAEGFRDAETFAAVAHAARNTEVPFMVLKHQVVNKRKPLDKAIAGLKPTVNAPIEANRARAEARSDIASLAS